LGEPRIVEPLSSWKVMLLRMWMELAERYVPEGNCTVPPPALAAASIARWIAAVSFVDPLPVAP
jgi:hypothetical protein